MRRIQSNRWKSKRYHVGLRLWLALCDNSTGIQNIQSIFGNSRNVSINTHLVLASNSYVLKELGHADDAKHVSSYLTRIKQIVCRKRAFFQLPENNSVSGLSRGLIEAWRMHGTERAGILFITANVLRNMCDLVSDISSKSVIIRLSPVIHAKSLKFIIQFNFLRYFSTTFSDSSNIA